MDKSTILAAIKEGKEELADHVKSLQEKGQQIGENRKSMKAKAVEIEESTQDLKKLEFIGGQLKDELHELKLRESRVKATIDAFKLMLPDAQ